MTDNELELKKRFAELRADDEANAPPYAEVRNRGTVEAIRPARRRGLWIAPTLLAAVAAGLAAVWFTTRAPSSGELESRDARLRDSSLNAFRWDMPTDGLLTSARRTLQTPALFGSVLDAAAVPIRGNPIKGD
jgi:hypothetical protein